MKNSLLLVMDNQFMESVQHRFHDTYECTLAKNSKAALKLMDRDSQFFAVLAVYQGDKTIAFFQKLKEIVPNTIRLMIADNADLEIAVKAINMAKVFSFFQQPVEMTELGDALSFALLEYERLQKIQADSLSDPLTDLYNRRFIDRELNRIFEVSRRHDRTFALIFADLNKFKVVNDTYGHALGDLLLKNIANIFFKTCRKTDLICRYGGDEFLILIEKAGNAQAERLIERLNEAVAELRIPEMEKEQFSFSSGQAAFPVDGTTKEAILEMADKRMYKVKKHRRR